MVKSIARKAGLMPLIVLPLLLSVSIVMASPDLNVAHVKSTDSAGVEKDYFTIGEDVYCIIKTTGVGSMDVDIYIVFNDEWHGGTPMTDRGDGAETVTLTGDGDHGPFLIWSGPLVPGEYDIVVDEDQDGIRDPGEKVDYSEVGPGFFVVPEVSTILLTLASFSAFALIAIKQRGVSLTI